MRRRRRGAGTRSDGKGGSSFRLLPKVAPDYRTTDSPEKGWSCGQRLFGCRE